MRWRRWFPPTFKELQFQRASPGEHGSSRLCFCSWSTFQTFSNMNSRHSCIILYNRMCYKRWSSRDQGRRRTATVVLWSIKLNHIKWVNEIWGRKVNYDPLKPKPSLAWLIAHSIQHDVLTTLARRCCRHHGKLSTVQPAYTKPCNDDQDSYPPAVGDLVFLSTWISLNTGPLNWYSKFLLFMCPLLWVSYFISSESYRALVLVNDDTHDR